MISDIIQIFEWFFTWLNHVNLNVQFVDGVKIRSARSAWALRLVESCLCGTGAVDWKPTGKDFLMDMSGFSVGKYRLIWNI